MWELAFPASQFILAQVVLVGVFVASGLAYLKTQRQIAEARANEPLSGRWLVAPTAGLLFGWVSAATLVGFATTLSALGVPGVGLVGVLVGGALLLLGGLLASAALLAGRFGPTLGYLSYGAAFLWALAAVMVNRYDVSEIITAIAALVALFVAAVLFVSWRQARARRLRPARPRTVR